METKALSIEVKDASKGIVRARFATLGVKDHDGDVTEPGAFGEQKVRVSAYNHASWQGALPVGKGTIHEEDGAAIADLQFFMSTTHGREHFETVKEMDDLGEWSYGFDILERAEPSEEQRQAGVVRIIKKVRVHEVSPVLLGAGVGTATLAVKAKDGAEKKGEPEPETKAGAEAEAEVAKENEPEAKQDAPQPPDELLRAAVLVEAARATKLLEA